MLLMKQFILLVGLGGMIHTTASGQSNNVGTWLVYFGNQKINDKWLLQSDLQFRFNQIPNQKS